MTRTEAERLLGILVGATTGWTTAADETFTFYTDALTMLRDVDAAAEAIRDVGHTWTEARRPSVAEINRAYSAVLRRRADAMPQLGTSRAVVPPPEVGRQIAAQAYADECARRDPGDPLILSGFRKRTPSNGHMTAILGGATGKVQR